jgi:hypothetical protein
MRVAKKIYDLCSRWLMAFFFLFPSEFPGFSVQMSENRWTDWCRTGDCCSRKRSANRWYFREFTSRVVGLGWSRRSFLPHRREGSC